MRLGRLPSWLVMLAVMGTAAALPMIDPRPGLSNPRPGRAEPQQKGPAVPKGPCVISFIGHEETPDRTRVILRANKPIDYRGGILSGNQVILDIANVDLTMTGTVVEIGTPEVLRVVIGPEIRKEGERVLKLRLTGVHARRHKVEMRGNELYIDLTAANGSREERGLPKMIKNDTAVYAMLRFFHCVGPA